MSGAIRCVALAALFVTAARASADELGPLFLASLPVTAPPGPKLDGPLFATLALHPGGEAKVASAQEWFRDAVAKDGTLELRLDRAMPRAVPTAAQRGATFLVDVDDPRVAGLRQEVVRRFGASPTVEDLTRFVDAWITKKSMGRIFDIASTVAVRREGDCTEHAVLLAAVARLFGHPSRVVLGIALTRLDGQLLALGHAWAEIHDGARWQLADATAVGIPAHLRYLPLGAIADEGPGYGGASWALLSPLDVKSVTLAATPSEAKR